MPILRIRWWRTLVPVWYPPQIEREMVSISSVSDCPSFPTVCRTGCADAQDTYQTNCPWEWSINTELFVGASTERQPLIVLFLDLSFELLPQLEFVPHTLITKAIRGLPLIRTIPADIRAIWESNFIINEGAVEPSNHDLISPAVVTWELNTAPSLVYMYTCNPYSTWSWIQSLLQNNSLDLLLASERGTVEWKDLSPYSQEEWKRQWDKKFRNFFKVEAQNEKKLHFNVWEEMKIRIIHEVIEFY